MPGHFCPAPFFVMLDSSCSRSDSVHYTALLRKRCNLCQGIRSFPPTFMRLNCPMWIKMVSGATHDPENGSDRFYGQNRREILSPGMEADDVIFPRVCPTIMAGEGKAVKPSCRIYEGRLASRAVGNAE